MCPHDPQSVPSPSGRGRRLETSGSSESFSFIFKELIVYITATPTIFAMTHPRNESRKRFI
jgi:hypothetical protein